jgi:hypothetical protein
MRFHEIADPYVYTQPDADEADVSNQNERTRPDSKADDSGPGLTKKPETKTIKPSDTHKVSVASQIGTANSL